MNSHTKKTTLLSILIITALGFSVYGNSLKGDFIWDDEYLIEKNTYIRNWSYLPQIFKEDIVSGAGKECQYYRPLQTLTYIIDYSLWGLDVRGYHLTNILLHILTALFVYGVINRLFNDHLLAFLTGCFFVVHPIHTEAVAYISGRADPLALLFMLICFFFYATESSSRKIWVYVPMLLSYAAALLSRENSLILPVLLLIYHYCLKRKFEVHKFLSVVSLALIYILLRVTVLKQLLPQATTTTTTFFQRLPGFFVALASYIKLLFFPLNLHMEYGTKLFHFGDLKTILGAVALIALLIVAFKEREKNKLVFFSIAWFLVALLPSSNLYPINAYMAEHWLYVPSIGFFLLAANVIKSLYKAKSSKNLAIIIIISALSFYSYLTIKQNLYWREAIKFYTRTLKYAPDSTNACFNLGYAYKKMNKNKEAMALYQRAIEINPDYAEAYNNLGTVFAAEKKYEEAIVLYKKAMEIKPDYAEPHNGLGLAYHATKREKEAIISIKKAIEIKPDYAEAYYNLGNVYVSMNQTENAIASYKAAIKINPDYAEAYNNIGNVKTKMKQNEKALVFYKKAIELNPNYAEAYNNLAIAENSLNKKEAAIAAYRKAIEIKPGNVAAYNNLGAIYNELNRDHEAETLYLQAIKINPHFAMAYNNLSVIYLKREQYPLAIKYCDKAKELGSVNTELLKLLEPYR